MEQHYAQALWEMIERGMEPKKAVHSLYEYLKTNGREALMPRIGKAFERLSAREERKNTVTLSLAHEKDIRKAKNEIAELVPRSDLGMEDMVTQIDETLIGGWRLEGKETLIDASFKEYLLDMYNAATI